MTMQNPPHPGEVLSEYLGGLSLLDAAAKIGIGSEHLSRLLDGLVGIDAKLAIKLGRAFGTSAEMWTGMQTTYDGFGMVMRSEIRSSIEESKNGEVQPYEFGASSDDE